ncbi:Phospholipase ddhd1 [Cichlidogyrus casuarinus]|uniref:Phospholipase ddhd1 n=1 Tax=Cichlidogyrus casuarinus TaxID=1844966 RepID=A0ABD2QDS4_9PLAT
MEEKVQREQNNTFFEIEIGPQFVRWFYENRRVNLKLTPFKGNDSLRLEDAYMKNIFQRDPIKPVVVREDLFEADISHRICVPIYWNTKNLDQCQCKQPWTHDILPTTITRGSWFRTDTWAPLSEPLALKIEQIHQKMIHFKRHCFQFTSRVKVINTEQIGSVSIVWLSNQEVYLDDNKVNKFVREKLRFNLVGVKLSRGYFSPATATEGSISITHLCLCVHGIGQSIGNFPVNVASFRKVCNELADEEFRSILQHNNKRLEFLPIEWRSRLRLDEGMVQNVTLPHLEPLRQVFNYTVLDVLYYTSPFHRYEIKTRVLSELIRVFRMFKERNPHFVQNKGRVSIIAHSLGSVIVYDILSRLNAPWNPSSNTKQSPKQPTYWSAEEFDVNLEQLAQEMKVAQKHLGRLERSFMTSVIAGECESDSEIGHREILPQIDHLFCIGSPLAMFLSIWGGAKTLADFSNERMAKKQVGLKAEDLFNMKFVGRIYNIFYPLDLFVSYLVNLHSIGCQAYRLEPLVFPHYSSIAPVPILCHNPMKANLSITKVRGISQLKRKEVELIISERFASHDSSFEDESTYCPLNLFESDSLGSTPTRLLPLVIISFLPFLEQVKQLRPKLIKPEAYDDYSILNDSDIESFINAQHVGQLRLDVHADDITQVTLHKLTKLKENALDSHMPTTFNLDLRKKAITNKLIDKVLVKVLNKRGVAPSEFFHLYGSEREMKEESQYRGPLPFLPRRLDFELSPNGHQQTMLGLVKSHQGYWKSKELARFVLKTILEEETK